MLRRHMASPRGGTHQIYVSQDDRQRILQSRRVKIDQSAYKAVIEHRSIEHNNNGCIVADSNAQWIAHPIRY
jgi:hypothetical protein